jgi:hypothetical protein
MLGSMASAASADGSALGLWLHYTPEIIDNYLSDVTNIWVNILGAVKVILESIF